MKQAAAFQATFTDWKLIRGRKVVQLVFEVPLEGADAAYNALGGMPDPGQSVWCAIAKLREPERKVMPSEPESIGAAETLQSRGGDATADKETEEPITEKLEPVAAPSARVSTITKRAGILCKEIRFQKFLSERYPENWSFMNEGTPEEKAAELMRFYCKVKSRREIGTTKESLQWWEILMGDFYAWRDHDMEVA